MSRRSINNTPHASLRCAPAGLLLALLAGCASLHSAPERVEVPVSVMQPCVLESDIPARPENVMLPGVNVERLAAGASADLRASDAYTRQLLALLRACAEPAK